MNWWGLFTLVKHEVHRTFKVWAQALFPPIVSTILFITIFYFVLGRSASAPGGVSYLEFLVPGLVIMNMVSAAYQGSSFSLFMSRYTKHFEHILTMPISYMEIVLGVLMGGLARSIITGAGIVAATSFFIPFRVEHVVLLVVYVLLAVFFVGSLGVLVGFWADKFDHLGIVVTFVLTPLTMLGGVFYSISNLPASFQKATLLNPVFYMVDGFRYAILGIHDAPIWQGLTVLFILGVAAFTFVVALLRSGWKVKE
ncbi:hypothetical protein D6783_00535 [Candidatus Woesearchaeota archaeon]|nr:MAG: hypothetical protein D6783_00535 [Candidatus Woesearchaeota archaeon]